MFDVVMYTDGACKGNPGAGGWATIIECKGVEKVISGGEAYCTNNRMELTAVVCGLEVLTKPCNVHIYSDSQYIVNSINKKWLYGWINRGWKNRAGEDTPNRDLWERLLPLLKTHRVTLEWVKGHSGIEKNERCDALAVAESQKFQ